MYIPTNHGNLFVETVNANKTVPLFLLPSGPGFDHLEYKINQSNFEKEFSVVYYDPRGCGKSLNFDSKVLTFEENIEDIERIRQFLGFEKIMLLGHSYGSMVALGYAIKYPQSVLKMVLSAGAPSATFLEKSKQNLSVRGNAEQISICNKYLWSGAFPNQEAVDNYLNIMQSMYSNKVANNSQLIKVFDPMLKCQFTPLNEGFRTRFGGFDFTTELHKITCATIILCGRNDWIHDPIYAEIMHKNIRNSKLIYFDAGHSIAFDCHSEYTAACTKFLAAEENTISP